MRPISARRLSWRWADAFLDASLPPVNEPVTVAFALPQQNLALRHRPRTIRARLRGDAVDAMDNFGTPLAYFAPLA